MTRYARGNGSKGSNNKQVLTPTSWSLLKTQSFGRNFHGNFGKCKVSKRGQAVVPLPEIGKGDSWFDFCANRKSVIARGEVHKIRLCNGFTSGNESFGQTAMESKKRIGFRVPLKEEIGCHGVTKKEKFSNKTFGDTESMSKTHSHISTSETLKKNAGSKIKGGLSEEDLKNKRMEKALKREKKKVCFCCRRWGHQLADCPDFKQFGSLDVPPPAGGLCYHCGSTEHNVNQCSKPGAKRLKFARCFVCGEDGHLSRECQDNPKGKYPKGGACRVCGETSHLCNDCPQGVNKTTESETILLCANEGPVDSLPEDREKCSQQNFRNKKVIQFLKTHLQL